MRTFALALVVAALPAATAASPALADTSDEQLAAGLARFDEGRKAFEAGQFEEALNAFQASLALLKSPNTRLYIGRCYRALGRTASALTALKLAALEAQDRLTASGEKRYSATRDAASQEAAALDPDVPRLRVVVPDHPPPGFVVKVGGRELSSAAWGVDTETDPGDVVVEATGPRLVPFKTKITLAKAARQRVDVPLSRIPTATLSVKLMSLPAGLRLALDGQPLPVSGADAPREVDVGVHDMVANAPGYLPFKWTQSLRDTESEVVVVALTPAPLTGKGAVRTPPWVFFTVAGAALASLGVGAGIAVNATNQQDQQLALNPYARDPGVKSSIQAEAAATDVLFVAGGVLGAGGVALAFLTRWKKTEGQAFAVAPWIGPTGGGIGAHGAF
jgi:hypothetical protein